MNQKSGCGRTAKKFSISSLQLMAFIISIIIAVGYSFAVTKILKFIYVKTILNVKTSAPTAEPTIMLSIITVCFILVLTIGLAIFLRKMTRRNVIEKIFKIT